MYRCLNCGMNFNFPVKVNSGETLYVCPNCNDYDIEELKLCEICEEEYTSPEKDRCCKCEDLVSKYMNEAVDGLCYGTNAGRDVIIKAIAHWIEH